ncbi:DUF5694 domain-containing protein [Sutcliffiella rhizosphaerae]|uniref:TraB/GumN family protein n=1 Tax=Sutcliffiella rhizosphaerae TaxID=2880967 RepID=A0ABM8YPQ5_9BACI|nr:DUF5694 domain-containing protein [Sutcliffiella rhizosphaerae]CAG9621758.1 hypothetical protein BACCIP111883_02531 [Sutcliffiella rhizosphaerae]
MVVNKPRILVLGTFHMSSYEELNSQERQEEINELVSKLEKFHPTKIAVEMEVSKNEELNKRYRLYKYGNYHLKMNEIYQIGFRLASKLQHEQLYAVDWMGKADKEYEEIEAWLKNNQQDLYKELFEGVHFPQLVRNKSLLEFYREFNHPFFLNQLNKLYVNMARIGDFNNYIGMDWLTWWYKRNLIIFSNLTRHIESKNENILFIVGCSHSSIVTKFLEESELCEIVDPVKFLS